MVGIDAPFRSVIMQFDSNFHSVIEEKEKDK